MSARRHVDARELLGAAWDALDAREAQLEPFDPHPALAVDADRFGAAVDEWLGRLAAPAAERPAGAVGTYPFGHPRYAGQMLKPPHPVALAAYAAAARLNPNNHALDGGPGTSAMEKEAVGWIAAAMGFPESTLGHLTGGGTVANLEALWVARESHPGRGVAVSEAAHYTHTRMAAVLGMDAHAVPADARDRIDLDALDALLAGGRVGTVVLTAGTTGTGAVDPIADGVALARRHGVRVHVDAAYGGFFRLLAGHGLPGFPDADFDAVGRADSLVIDPHKHGLQPYGCGCVLFRDPAVGRHYRHDSPYTYFTSDALHLGEISLECSRPGAAAAALWLTLRALPLAPDDGLGPILRACLSAAGRFAAAVEASAALELVAPSGLDIVIYRPAAGSASRVDRRSASLFARAMEAERPVFTSLYRVPAARLGPGVDADVPHARVLRSVLLKPEHEAWAELLVADLDVLARGATDPDAP